MLAVLRVQALREASLEGQLQGTVWGGGARRAVAS